MALEYKTTLVMAARDEQAKLNTMGAEGWEHYMTRETDRGLILYFKKYGKSPEGNVRISRNRVP